MSRRSIFLLVPPLRPSASPSSILHPEKKQRREVYRMTRLDLNSSAAYGTASPPESSS
ncbi:hypothetical protein F2Q68_00024381 [Brassica cretica]|uniref:Uncharacterized protein n=1 Tax=Brassica cretica TaxID=69181 RepID=A0A8S9IJS5_BRACR|nr:hypothetical protein F2Q68_00024381 [Brassica cretica]KAF3559279.1 hypothetical protein F2Q69_00011176 [Brassica cretica]